ncbi:hypothetical protein LIER_33362 [Lithospermum erythrorhizon]|uniref:Amino acid transporter transmembrane domain-containing protein n=1 Tax=Lithospermum erythrorhizon TaxID=34254 RepID=A0AAV3RYP9_LITER
MGTLAQNSAAVLPKESTDESKNVSTNLTQVDDTDAGVLFVLKSRGSWLHCGYHLTTAIVAPALLSLPYAFTMLGWAGGMLCLTAAGLVTFYSYTLLSLVLEHHAALGKRQLRFRDMAHDILGIVFSSFVIWYLMLFSY